jgi:hypothetical protein
MRLYHVRLNHDRKIFVGWVERSETQRRQVAEKVGFHSWTQTTYIISDLFGHYIIDVRTRCGGYYTLSSVRTPPSLISRGSGYYEFNSKIHNLTLKTAWNWCFATLQSEGF